MDLYDPKTGRFDPTPLEDFSMWATLQRGGANANIPLLKEFVYQWVKATTQKTAGQRKRGKDIDHEGLVSNNTFGEALKDGSTAD